MKPAQLEQLIQQGLAQQRAGKLQAAAAIFAGIRTAAPRNFDGWHLGGNIALLQSNPEEASKLYTQALRINPRSAIAATCLGVARLAAGDLLGAEAHQRTALRLDPKNAPILSQLATVLNRTGRYDEAVKCYKQAVTLDPKSAQAWHGYGTALSNQNLAAEALECERRAIAADNKYAPARRGYAVALQKCHRVPEAVREYENILTLNPQQLEVYSHRLFALNYLHSHTPASLFEAHKAYGEIVGKNAHAISFSNSLEPDRKLRVAFFSADFREHSVAYFLEPLLRFLDREQFEIMLYNFCNKPDAVTRRFRELAAIWRDFPSEVTTVLEPIVRADAADIAIDLGGHTGNSLLPLFARRIAPVQISYLGYPNTTGLTAMDYRLVDEITDPPGDADRFHSEKLVRFAPTAWTYSAPAGAPEPVAPPCLSRGHVTFGSFNNFSKVTDEIIRTWARLLGAVERSRLLLKSTGLADATVVSHVRDRLRAAGLPDDRVELSGLTATTVEHLAAYAVIDVALDTNPYNGTTTTCEALWMGVPVITQLGDRHAARVGASLLLAIRHEEWIAHDQDEYIKIASDLATDRARLTALRLNLRQEMQQSVLMNHPGQAAKFGAALRDCWRAWCAKQNP